jgi:hypothetical protein
MSEGVNSRLIEGVVRPDELAIGIHVDGELVELGLIQIAVHHLARENVNWWRHTQTHPHTWSVNRSSVPYRCPLGV